MKTTAPSSETAFPALTGTSPRTERKTLKDDIKSDLVKRQVWFDDEETADYRLINGVRLLCVLDRCDSTLAATDSERSTRKDAALMSGLQTDLYLLFVRSDEYGPPRVGEEMTVDGRKFFIREYIGYEGVYEITLKTGAVR